MITDVLDFIDSYDNIRSVLGLNTQELKDAELGLIVYRNALNSALSGITGIYGASTDTRTLLEIWEDDPLADTDLLYYEIQLYSIYLVSDEVLRAVGLRAYKSIADGKGSLTRFSPESTYKDTERKIKDALDIVRKRINSLVGNSSTDATLVEVITPITDLVTNE